MFFYFRVLCYLFALLLVTSCRKWENPCDPKIPAGLSLNSVPATYASQNINICVASDIDGKFPVKLELYSGATFIQTITDSARANDTYTWLVPDNLDIDMQYRIKVSLHCRPDESAFSNAFNYINWKDYNCITPYQLSNFFIEDFIDNSHSWFTGTSGNLSASISNGLYTVVNSGSDSPKIWLITSLSDNNNFQIEARMKYTSTNTINYLGCLWGFMNTNDYFGFFFENSQYFELEKSVSDTLSSLINRSFSMAIVTGGFNKITIRKINASYYFFINETYVASCPFVNFFINANKIAFYVSPHSNNQIDFIKIFNLN